MHSSLLFYVSLSIFYFPSFSFKAVCCSIKKSHDYFAKQKKKLCAFSLHIRRFHQFPNIHVTVQHGVPNKQQDAMNVWITNVSANRFEVCLQESTTFSGLHDKLSVVCKNVTMTKSISHGRGIASNFLLFFHFAELDGVRILPVSLGGKGVLIGEVFQKRRIICTRQLRSV